MKEPAVITPGWDYICFTDDPQLRSDAWDVLLSPRTGPDLGLEQKKYAMKHMILGHQYLAGYDLSLSMGAQLVLNCHLDELLRDSFTAGDEMMLCFHPERDCVYDEAAVCKALLLDDPACIDAQMQRYRAAGYPAHNGLYSTGIMARWHKSENVRAVCELWWEEYLSGSRRDQLSLNYALWRSAPVKISALDFAEQYFVKRNFQLCAHKWPVNFAGTQIELESGEVNAANDGESPDDAVRDYVGYIDAANDYGIRGWAADRKRLNTSISVSLYDGGTLVETRLANQLRADVGAYLGDNGLHGFTIPLPPCLKDETPHSISIRFETSAIHLPVSRPT